MGYEPGGRADKLGNRYEVRWVAQQLLLLIRERVRSVTVEAVGDDERGVDLWVGLDGGRRIAYQCKARNRGKPQWSVADLSSSGVLTALRVQLDRSPNYRFSFVSAVPATLRDICDSARNSGGDPESFYNQQVVGVSKERARIFGEFCQVLKLDPECRDGRRRAYDYLQRSTFEVLSDGHTTQENLELLADSLLTGHPKTVISTLCQYAEHNDRLGAPIYPDELWRYLKSQGILARNLAHDSSIAPRVALLREEYLDFNRSRLIDGALIQRQETTECLDALETHALVMLHGTAGSGKSAVIFELLYRLEENGFVCLPLRLDRTQPMDSARRYGEQLDLPSSPVWCLDALAGDRPSVVILDQLDALRWTSSHSVAFDVCKELLRQVAMFRHEGKDVRAILACRTYDLEQDELRGLLKALPDLPSIRIKVESLPDEDVRKLVKTDRRDMTKKQRSVLANPQSLRMWVELHTAGDAPALTDAASLMRHFWQFKRSQVEQDGVDTTSLNEALDTVVDWMDVKGTLVAPSRVTLRCSSRAIDSLCSHDMLVRQGGVIGFAHQTYLDFLIAEKVLDQISTRGSILDWLGGRDRQTLNRRGRLSHALALLAEESQPSFVHTATEIIESPDVRFHLKDLVLGLAGQIEEFEDALSQWAIGLAEDPVWRPHIVQTMCMGHAAPIRLLCDRGIVDRWLRSDDELLVRDALSLLGSAINAIPDDTIRMLWEYVDNDRDRGQTILRAIGWEVSADAEAVFDLRLRLARLGVVDDLIDWPVLSQTHPLRAIRLVEAMLSLRGTAGNVDDERRYRAQDTWTSYDLDALLSAAERQPLETWDLLMPHIERLSSATSSTERAFSQHVYARAIQNRRGGTDWENGAAEMAVRAGRKLAEQSPDLLLERTLALEDCSSPAVQRIMVESYASLPPANADRGIRWLLARPVLFRVGDGYSEPEWMPASRLLSSLSPHCSRSAFADTEKAIVCHVDPEDRLEARACLERRRCRGMYLPYWGCAQYFMLRALDESRLSLRARRLLSHLRALYDRFPQSYYLKMAPVTGGFVGSSLERTVERIRDQSWLAIIRNTKVPPVTHRSRQLDDSSHVESSVEQFAHSLRRMARRFPERFGRLVLQFPKDVHPAYVSAVLDALTLTKPGSDVPKEEVATWLPASPSTLMAAIDKHHGLADREGALSFCRLLGQRRNEAWPSPAVDRLAHYAMTHHDPAPDSLAVQSGKGLGEATVDTLFTNSINCVRGVAIESIGHLLFDHADWLPRLESCVACAVEDPHPAVRIAATSALLPLLSIVPDQAVAWFMDACEGDLRVASSPHAINFLNHTIRDHSVVLIPLIQRMVCSDRNEVAEQGAQAATAYYLFYGLLEQEMHQCRVGTEPQRVGVAHIAAQFLARPEYRSKCMDTLTELLDDPCEEVQRFTASVFSEGFFDLDGSVEYAARFLQSEAFKYDPSTLLQCLLRHSRSLLPISDIVLRVCEASVARLGDTPAFRVDHRSVVRDIPTLLLRLYDTGSVADSGVAQRCLDVLDLLLERGAVFARALTRAIDD